MDLVNFRTETDADGVMLATWDVPGRSMNVITPQVMDELAAIIDAVVADPAVKGCVIVSGKESFSGGADLSNAAGAAARSSTPCARARARRRRCASSSRNPAS